ncbi:MAG: hypothetical protein PHP26_01660 [Syntrophomonas sp.]|uniref:hypothetical protein n=1 Tax=Syntrophomonas sp. TaxID=2053627 RepID=UPI002620AF56|nr:hypothetical protein [Syntrophomonas sp.]MDD2509912.1 hypothetical protein [Syntrophomonas sp.]MDD3878679.1 hypothetical protein [Syntrophomonas sp.]MDD4626040.1 hypothetical protein [Syntrophomonas sp.]
MGNQAKGRSKITTRKTRRFASNSLGGQGLDSHMFIEDLYLGIVPIQPLNTLYEVKLEPYNKEIENILIRAFPSYYGESRDLIAAIFGFIQDTANMLAYSGYAYYEIVYERSSLQSKPDRFYLESIPSLSLHKFCNKYIQIIPKEAIKFSESKRLIMIPSHDIVAISIPKELGGPIKYGKLLKQMNLLSKLPPEFSIQEMAFNTRKIGFDFTEYQKRIEITKAKTTSTFGWNSRLLWKEECLEFYLFYRHLIFERSQAILRNCILEAINETLYRTGQQMGFCAKMIVTGLPMVQDINKDIEDLLSGELSFEDAARVGLYS